MSASLVGSEMCIRDSPRHEDASSASRPPRDGRASLRSRADCVAEPGHKVSGSGPGSTTARA
eukprot:6803239-Alexandrium_andersonii.AAC.1